METANQEMEKWSVLVVVAVVITRCDNTAKPAVGKNNDQTPDDTAQEQSQNIFLGHMRHLFFWRKIGIEKY